VEIDLALLTEDYEQAERLVAACTQESGAVLARKAVLAMARRQTTEAQEAATQALLLAHEEEDRFSEEHALLVLARAQARLGNGLQAAMAAEQALALARRRDSPAGIAHARLVQGRIVTRQGRFGDALSFFYEARSLGQEHGRPWHLAEALHSVAWLQEGRGAFLDALANLQQELAIWRDLGLRGREARALLLLAVVCDQLGHHTESLRSIECARQICEQMGDRIGVARCQYHLVAGLPYRDEGLVGQAVAMATEALAVFRTHDQPAWEGSTLATLGYALWLDGQHATARDALRQAYALLERLGEMGFLPEILAYQGLAHLGLGQLAEALECTRRALLAMAQGALDNDIVSEIYYAHAAVLAAHGQEDQAHRYFGRAYHKLLEYAAQLEDEAARQSFFRRDPTVR